MYVVKVQNTNLPEQRGCLSKADEGNHFPESLQCTASLPFSAQKLPIKIPQKKEANSLRVSFFF